jgi:hypothetical protein
MHDIKCLCNDRDLDERCKLYKAAAIEGEEGAPFPCVHMN